MNRVFRFGEEVSGYDYLVINERDARASAGIMFLFGIISFLIFIMLHNLFWAELFSLTFILEFFIRVFVNPNYAPYMVLGSLFVSNQQPDWVEAKPKKFAWILGLILGVAMAYFIVFGVISPARMLICLVCLILLFVESVFGICLGCMLYKKFNVDLRNCPGGVCETPPDRRGSLIGKFAILAVFAMLTVGTYQGLKSWKYNDFQSQMPQVEENDPVSMIESAPGSKSDKPVKDDTGSKADKEEKDCTPPDWAVAIGHKDLWKEHHGCK